jgi:hypothetical protein
VTEDDEWVSGPISTEPVNEQILAFKPPQEYKKVDTWQSAVDMGWQHDPLIDKPAPDFTLPVLVGPKTSKSLRLNDLKGKAPVIVF